MEQTQEQGPRHDDPGGHVAGVIEKFVLIADDVSIQGIHGVGIAGAVRVDESAGEGIRNGDSKQACSDDRCVDGWRHSVDGRRSRTDSFWRSRHGEQQSERDHAAQSMHIPALDTPVEHVLVEQKFKLSEKQEPSRMPPMRLVAAAIAVSALVGSTALPALAALCCASAPSHACCTKSGEDRTTAL